MPELWALKGVIEFLLWAALLVLKGYAFADAIYRPQEAYPAANKQTKTMWLLLLGLSLVTHFLFSYPITILNVAGTIVSAIYVVGVRPALREFGGGGSKRGGRVDGPYGPW